MHSVKEMLAAIADMRAYCANQAKNGGEFMSTFWEDGDFTKLFFIPTGDGSRRCRPLPMTRAWEFCRAFVWAYRTNVVKTERPTDGDYMQVYLQMDCNKQTPAARPAANPQRAAQVLQMMQALPNVPEEVVIQEAKPPIQVKLAALVNKFNKGQPSVFAQNQAAQYARELEAVKDLLTRRDGGSVTVKGDSYSGQYIMHERDDRRRWVLLDADASPVLIAEWRKVHDSNWTKATWYTDDATPTAFAAMLVNNDCRWVKNVNSLPRHLVDSVTPRSLDKTLTDTQTTVVHAALDATNAAESDVALLKEQIVALQAQLTHALHAAEQTRGDAVRVMTTANDLLATAATAMRSKKLKAADRNEIVTQRIDAAMDDMTKWMGK